MYYYNLYISQRIHLLVNISRMLLQIRVKYSIDYISANSVSLPAGAHAIPIRLSL